MAAVRTIANGVSFRLLPTKVKINNGHKKIQLAAILDPGFKLPLAQILATVKDKRTGLRYTQEMKDFIKKNKIDITVFKPLETYLKGQVKQAKKHPELFLTLLTTYLQNGITPTFDVSFATKLAPIIDSQLDLLTDAEPDLDLLTDAQPDLETMTDTQPELASLTDAIAELASLTDAVPELASLTDAEAELAPLTDAQPATIE